MKLLVRGGSISAGKGVSTSYVDRLRDSLSPRGIEVINRSRERDTSFEGNWTFDEDIDPFRPELLLLHFGIDDIYRPVYRSEFKENLVQIVRLSRKKFSSEIILVTSQPFNSDYEMQSAGIYYRTIREVALDLHCVLVPIHYLIAQELDSRNMSLADIIQDDDRLINETGHELFFNIINEKVLDLLESMQTRLGR
jgi:lysophospholipase L1-like esterase